MKLIVLVASFVLACQSFVYSGVEAGRGEAGVADLNLTYIGEAVGPNEKLTYFLQGPADGEVVVLLAGMGRGAGEFRELAAELNKAGYRTVAMQPRGAGRSGPVLTDPTYDKFADDVELTLNDIPGGIAGGKAHVLGYEFGNRIARMFAVKYPDRVGALILLACGGQETSSSSSDTETSKTSKSSSGTRTKKASSATASLSVTAKIDSFFQDLAAEPAETDPQHITQSGMTAIFAYWLTSSEREPYAHKAFFAPMSKVPYYWITGWYRDTGWMQAAMDADHVSTSAVWVGGGNAPMLILQGQYDVAAPVSNGTYMKKTYPDRVTLGVVPDAGHAMLAEQPAFINDQVISYLGKHPIENN
ncbi:alpha/beta fold hydrolase [Candidatus Omnitrophota bacterium]